VCEAAHYPNGRALTDDVFSTRMIFMTHGRTTPQHVKAHDDLTSMFPFLGTPNPRCPRATPAYPGGRNMQSPALEEPMAVKWDDVTQADVLRAIQEYDRLGPERFFSEHGFAPTTTYELVRDERRYPPKAILGTAYEFATGRRLASGDFEGGKTGAVRVLERLGFNVQRIPEPPDGR
jgi:hypothetical protein